MDTYWTFSAVSVAERKATDLERELTAVGGAGNVRIYRLCADCYGASQCIRHVAEGVEGEPWIVV